MNRLEKIKPAVDVAAKEGGLPAPIFPFPVGFDGDAWVWTWRQEKAAGIAEASVVARPQAEVGVEIRVSGSAWMPEKRQVAASRLFYSRFFEQPPPVDVLSNELGPPLKRAWQSALIMADQLSETEKSRAAFLSSLKAKGWLVE